MSFERLLKPRSIAVFGGAQAQEVIRQCDLMGYEGEIWPGVKHLSRLCKQFLDKAIDK